MYVKFDKVKATLLKNFIFAILNEFFNGLTFEFNNLIKRNGSNYSVNSNKWIIHLTFLRSEI